MATIEVKRDRDDPTYKGLAGQYYAKYIEKNEQVTALALALDEKGKEVRVLATQLLTVQRERDELAKQLDGPAGHKRIEDHRDADDRA
jgi:hypothetical protein